MPQGPAKVFIRLLNVVAGPVVKILGQLFLEEEKGDLFGPLLANIIFSKLPCQKTKVGQVGKGPI